VSWNRWRICIARCARCSDTTRMLGLPFRMFIIQTREEAKIAGNLKLWLKTF
jgi:hypothetical protein